MATRLRQLADVVTGQLQGALTPAPGLGIVRERGQAIQFLKNPQEKLGALDTLEAAEVLVMPVRTADDQFHSLSLYEILNAETQRR